MRHLPRYLFTAAFIGCMIGSVWQHGLRDVGWLMLLGLWLF